MFVPKPEYKVRGRVVRRARSSRALSDGVEESEERLPRQLRRASRGKTGLDRTSHRFRE